VEQGSHTQLLQLAGLYARLYELQFATAPVHAAVPR
jgi:ABC-type multidrug transport system fused ATPase/permease subunit